MKRLGVILICLILCVSLFGCSNGDNATTDNPNNSVSQNSNEATISCTIKIDCSSILTHKDDLKEGHEAYVGDGAILKETTVNVNEGATAYDLLKAVCDNNDIALNVANSSYGKYVAGINNIDEKDCGEMSGWGYTVNGEYPTVGVSEQVLNDGDVVEFTYMCEW